jgi:translation initiation factor IF-1
MSKQDKTALTFDGIVKGIQKTFYSVEFPDIEVLEGKTVRAQLSGKMRMYNIRVIIGDRVTVELDPYDLTKGRITYRRK